MYVSYDCILPNGRSRPSCGRIPYASDVAPPFKALEWSKSAALLAESLCQNLNRDADRWCNCCRLHWGARIVIHLAGVQPTLALLSEQFSARSSSQGPGFRPHTVPREQAAPLFIQRTMQWLSVSHRSPESQLLCV